MSRIEGKISGKGKDPVDSAEILAALASEQAISTEKRRAAVSRCLSGGEGWREASSALGGAFAEADPWLKAEKEE